MEFLEENGGQMSDARIEVVCQIFATLESMKDPKPSLLEGLLKDMGEEDDSDSDETFEWTLQGKKPDGPGMKSKIIKIKLKEPYSTYSGHRTPFPYSEECGPPPGASDEEKKMYLDAWEAAKPQYIGGCDPYRIVELKWWEKLLQFFKIKKYNTGSGIITIYGTGGDNKGLYKLGTDHPKKPKS